MNIIAIWLVMVGTKSGPIVMCKILTVVVAFLYTVDFTIFEKSQLAVNHSVDHPNE